MVRKRTGRKMIRGKRGRDENEMIRDKNGLGREGEER